MKKIACALVALLLVACANLVVPQSLDQRLAYAMVQVTAVRDSAADLVERDRMSVEDGEQVLALTDNARLLIETARTTQHEDEDKALQQLRLAQQVLGQIEVYLGGQQ